MLWRQLPAHSNDVRSFFHRTHRCSERLGVLGDLFADPPGQREYVGRRIADLAIGPRHR